VPAQRIQATGGGPAGNEWKVAAPNRRLPRPTLTPGLPIGRYSHELLVGLVRYLRSDDVIRTREQEQTLLMEELGFARRGKNIITALEAAQSAADRPTTAVTRTSRSSPRSW
jgi:hypothetical protein